jgi:hypothetical protein
MTKRQWLLAGAMALAGCATSGGVSDNEVARLPVDDRAQVVTAHQSIDIAQSNLAAAKLGRDEAKQFRKIAARDLEAAKSNLEAARVSVDLSKSTRDDRTLRDAGRREDAARDQLIAARAKMDYADRLIELRYTKIDEAEANLAAARADVELTKYRLVAHNGIETKADAKKLESVRQETQDRLAETRARVAALEGDVAQLKTAWDERQRDAWTASRGQPRQRGAAPPAAEAPAPPALLPDVRRGDVNDTPSAPATPQSQQPSNNIAPAP